MLDFSKGPILMGVVNVTPDSFSDGGAFLEADKAIEHGLRLRAEGADILDIGGESTRPGAAPVSVQEEIDRVLPVIEGLKDCGAVISIDTRHAQTMRAAISAGAGMINDVSALTHDAEALDVAAENGVPVCLMHMLGNPQTMQSKPEYEDVVQDVFSFLQNRIVTCVAAGIDQKRIICDPGIGFGKTLEHNLKLLKNLDKFNALNAPLMLGASRKSFIEKIVPGTPVEARLPGSLAAALAGLQAGVQIFRIHDVAETKQFFSVFQAVSAAK